MLFFVLLFGVLGGLIAPFALRAWRTGSVAPFKEAGQGMLAGAAAGLGWGVGARVAMRIVAVVDGQPAEFSVGGTLFVLLVGTVVGLPLGLLFAIVRGRLPGSGIGKGLTFGAIPAMLLLTLVAVLVAWNLDRRPPDISALIGAALFAALFVGVGLCLELMFAGRRRPTATPPAVTGSPVTPVLAAPRYTAGDPPIQRSMVRSNRDGRSPEPVRSAALLPQSRAPSAQPTVAANALDRPRR